MTASATRSVMGDSATGLSYPFGRDGPAPGAVREVAPGIGWLRLDVPGPLRHVNCWVLDEDDGGIAIVDTGMDLPDARIGWSAAFDGALAGKRVARVIGTHFHPDHIGLAGWLCGRDDAPLWMTRGEFLTARTLEGGSRGPIPDAFIDFWRMAGWDERQLQDVGRGSWGLFDLVTSPLPFGYCRLVEGQVLPIGGREWRIVVGSGHSPEHACLLDEAAGILLSGDQILPRISSNISLGPMEPAGDPLGEWLRSIARLRELPGDLLVLPGHGEPFTGLHARLDAMAGEHRQRLDTLARHLAEPRRAVDCLDALFARPIGDEVLGMASGEAMAHLRHLEVTGRAVRETIDGVAWWRATA